MRPGVPEAVADLGQPGVPHVERHGRRLVEPAAGLAQQHVALAHDAVELEAQRVVLHGQRDERVVEEAPPVAGAALDQRQVVGREHGDPHHAEQVAGPAEPLAVDLHAVAARRHQLGLDQRRRARRRRRTSARTIAALGADAHQRVGRRAAEAAERRQVGERLGEVRLALPVVADDDRRARPSARTTPST